ncbi:hypothetical protein CC80DRAFT_545233 [Byssothecium circinans]|uniref:Uncharacterized protein n=1 Tax=Byssothecium circinans TaxID=147558 RepID=A0A6A5U647_9PLEO|nr:hypothetical protein CC80DRAFT_545233 [Byssothecium circinans]
MVRRVVFADGISWVARVRLPPLNALDHELLDVASILKVEIASMKFLKAKTSIPVPGVHSYSVDLTNDVLELRISCWIISTEPLRQSCDRQ